MAKTRAFAGPREPAPQALHGAPAVTAAPAQILSRRHTHIRDGVVLGCAGVTTSSFGDITSSPALMAGGVGLAAVGAATSVLGHRTKMRHDLEDKLAQALAPLLLGVKSPDWRTVRLARWTRGWPGVPRRITLKYEPGIDGTDPEWRHGVLAVLSQPLLATYKVAKHDPRGCVLQLALDTSVVEEIAIPAVQERAMNALARQMPTSQVVDAQFDEATGELVSITATHEIPDKIANAGYRRRLEGVMTSMHEGRWRGVWDMTGDKVRFERRPTMSTSIWIPADSAVTDSGADGHREVNVPYAVDEDGNELAWYPAKLPHWLITGSTGSGKTSTLNGVINQFARAGWPIWLGDPKQVEFMGLRDYPNVQLVSTKIWEIAAMIHRARTVMDTRYDLITTGQAKRDDFGPLVLVIDELTEFVTRLTAWYKSIKVTGEPATCPTLDDLASIFRLGRTGRVHVVAAMQRPDARFLDGENKENLKMRTSFGRLSPQAAQMMWENMSVGVSLPMVPQRGMTYTLTGPVEVQAYRFPDLDTDDPQQQQMLQAMRPTKSLHDRFLFVPPEPREGEKQEFLFRDYLEADMVEASTVPHLDPLEMAKNHEPIDPAILASPTRLIGLGAGAASTTAPTDSAVLVEDPSNVGVDDDYVAEDPNNPYSADYAEEEYLPVTELRPGDLVDEDGDWVVVETEPEPDVDDEDLVVIAWRSDTDGAGTISVPDGELLLVRRAKQPEEGSAS